eukprot:CAMPEP_0197654486 /NCGR_PEP_ID=MMETSP1338-20131121/38875_1 /TAXON_ID=43686 ORGANISM="Pelagodinium beii, Strain RCC1491" /NCGR_SAMPLE_ID=MMETSP1338 /ASSEMBLY_ACC=CAM_ASM_000754 /LENGTH=326 /DNA_ID=CAMNT_0043229935 /DNA_START=62 /DNA_END=1042 /DNA_ORIENTATION=+
MMAASLCQLFLFFFFLGLCASSHGLERASGVPSDAAGCASDAEEVGLLQVNHYEQLNTYDKLIQTVLGIAQVTSKPLNMTNHCGLHTQLSYFRSLNLAFCTCSKCGSTSLYNRIYDQLFHHAYPSHPEKPYVQNPSRWADRRVDFESWEEAKKAVKNESQKVDMIAVFRDPYDRLVSSWQSKFWCEKPVDGHDRAWMVPELLKLAGVPQEKWVSCLNLADFAMLLQQVYLDGNSCKLESHLLPQSMGCFAELEPEDYTITATVQQISELYPRVFAGLGHTHKSSRGKKVFIDPTTDAILRNLAAAEEWQGHVKLQLPELQVIKVSS